MCNISLEVANLIISEYHNEEDRTLQRDIAGGTQELRFTVCYLKAKVYTSRVSRRLLLMKRDWCDRKLTHSLMVSTALTY